MFRTGCDRVERWLGAYRDGALGRGRARRVEAHLLGCGRCRAALESFQKIGETLRAHPPPALSARQVESLLAGVRQRILARGVTARHRGWKTLGAPPMLRDAFVVHPRMSWGTAAVLVALLVWFVGGDAGRRLVGPGAPPMPIAPIVVESLEGGPQTSVMLFTPPHSNLKVIWIFEEPREG